VDETASLHEVVVGVHGSAGARAALDWALREAMLRDRAVRMVTVSPVDEPLSLHDGGRRLHVAGVEQDVRARMRAEAAEVAAVAGCDAVPVHAEVRYGQPAQQLVDAAGSGGLLVVGSRGRESLRGALLGSVSRQCAQYAADRSWSCATTSSRMAPCCGRGAASRVVVGVDGSAGSVIALRFAAAEARLRGGELHVVHAWIGNLSGYGGLLGARPATTLREQADTTLLESLRAVWQNGYLEVQVRAESIEGAE